ncbi:unnamed protein product [Schistocephalus solidus]|uniref:C2H2-type domain-containing protein n=1 Tax=Schistocephalus solidus TaxID=70667 RepID=A0A183SKG1_SCHSO|nr:unnamed protein product [Schistocephalus solidus]
MELLERSVLLRVYAQLKQLQLRLSDHLVRLDDKLKPKRIVYGDVATDSRRRMDKVRSYKETLETSVNPLRFLLPTLRRNFNSCIGLVGHLRIDRMEAGEAVPGAPTYRRHALFRCPHCSRNFTHHMGLLGHMRLHENLR